MSPTRNKKAPAQSTTRACSMSGTRARLTAATTVKIAPLPSRAVGFLCQRSLLGRATTPRRRASARTTGVSTSVPANERTTGRRSMGFINMTYRAERSGAESNARQRKLKWILAILAAPGELDPRPARQEARPPGNVQGHTRQGRARRDVGGSDQAVVHR